MAIIAKSLLIRRNPRHRFPILLCVTDEHKRLQEERDQAKAWKRWGPYLAERAWGTVREDYSADGAAWEYFPHDQARSRAYRWNEDGIGGICDRRQLVCLSFAFWNGKDPILKERMFGLTCSEGNHGEDVKECYWYLDSTPTHSRMSFLYRYPQGAYPYCDLLEKNRQAGRENPEVELEDLGAFDEGRYWDIHIEYAKASPEDICCLVTVTNRGPETSELTVLPQVWFRNTWAWHDHCARPQLSAYKRTGIELEVPRYGKRWLLAEGATKLLFTENDTNTERLFQTANKCQYVKDAFHRYVVNKEKGAINPSQCGTKGAFLYRLQCEPGESKLIRLRLTDCEPRTTKTAFDADFEETFVRRRTEADEFYAAVIPDSLGTASKQVVRQALSGMLWSKQYYHYVVEDWLQGDATQLKPPTQRWQGRNHGWRHVWLSDVISMPDKWEYPWFAAWDLAFHCQTLALVDPEFAKRQLMLLLHERTMHPNGQLPAYEWAFGDVNPPVHAWACLRVFQLDGRKDFDFLAKAFHKLLLNFTWWVNRKDVDGNDLFSGGFLGLDNVGVFDRSAPLPNGVTLEQSDGTSWMASYCLDMLDISVELSKHDPSYGDMASKFWEHFVAISKAAGEGDQDLWNEADGFYYDVLVASTGDRVPLEIRSLVGLVPLLAVSVVKDSDLQDIPSFNERVGWFLRHKPEALEFTSDKGKKKLMSLVPPKRLKRVLARMLDEDEFLSPYGIRSMSRSHAGHPFEILFDHHEHTVDYEPAESTTGLFGGNSNWRGPLWMPINFLLVESLRQFHDYFGSSFKVELPTGSGHLADLGEVADDLAARLCRLFLPAEDGSRPFLGGTEARQDWSGLVQFNEYFHGDSGRGLGASHQTGWTGLVANLLIHSAASKR